MKVEKNDIKRILEEMHGQKFHELLTIVVNLARQVKKLPIDKEIYVHVFLNDGENFYALAWTSWEDVTTKEKIVFFESEDKSILVPLHSINRIELLYEKPSSESMGFRETLDELKPVVSDNVKVGEKVIVEIKDSVRGT